MQLNFDAIPFLKTADLPWVQYKLKKKLGAETVALKKKLVQNNRVKELVKECRKWPGSPMKRHNDATHLLHKICLLIDFGLDIHDEGIPHIAENLLKHQADNGAFLTNLLIPKHFGGTGEASMEWLLSDFPIILYILLYFGFKDNPRVLKAIDLLKNSISENGWGCIGSMPKFRGPGRKSDHCPYATLVALQAFSLLPEYYDEPFIKTGCDATLSHWEKRTERKIYMFAMGTDFKKLKYPNLWFEITHVCKVLHHFPYARKSKPFQDMIQIIIRKQQENGGFIPESIYTAYKGWDFGQKKAASPSLTCSIWEMFENLKKKNVLRY